MVPALIDNNAKIAVDSNGDIEVKPHGHGDIHKILYETGTAKIWRDLGKKWLVCI